MTLPDLVEPARMLDYNWNSRRPDILFNKEPWGAGKNIGYTERYTDGEGGKHPRINLCVGPGNSAIYSQKNESQGDRETSSINMFGSSETKLTEHLSSEPAMDISREGEIAVLFRNQIAVYDTSGTESANITLKPPFEVNDKLNILKYTPDGNLLINTYRLGNESSGEIWWIDKATGERRLLDNSSMVVNDMVATKENIIVSGRRLDDERGDCIIVYDKDGRNQVRQLKMDNPQHYQPVEFVDGGSKIIYYLDKEGNVNMWDWGGSVNNSIARMVRPSQIGIQGNDDYFTSIARGPYNYIVAATKKGIYVLNFLDVKNEVEIEAKVVIDDSISIKEVGTFPEPFSSGGGGEIYDSPMRMTVVTKNGGYKLHQIKIDTTGSEQMYRRRPSI